MSLALILKGGLCRPLTTAAFGMCRFYQSPAQFFGLRSNYCAVVDKTLSYI